MNKLLLTALALSGFTFVAANDLRAQTGAAGSDDKGGTTGMMTTTPRDASDDAVGTRGTMVDNVIGADHSLHAMRSDAVVGKTVYGAAGEEIGEIDNVVMTMGGDTPEAVIGVGGFLGIGERDITIPLARIDMQGDRLVTSMTKAEIEAREPYARDSYQAWDSNRTFGTVN